MANLNKYKKTKAEQQVRDTLQFLWDAGTHNPNDLIKATGIPPATVYRTIKKIKSGKGVGRKAGSGKVPILRGDDRRRVTQLANHNQLMNCATIAAEAASRGSPLVSRWTI